MGSKKGTEGIKDIGMIKDNREKYVKIIFIPLKS